MLTLKRGFFLIIEFWELFIYCGYKSYSRWLFSNTFFQSVACGFFFSIFCSAFWRAEVFDEVQLVDLFFCGLCFALSKISKVFFFFPYVLIKKFIVSGFTFDLWSSLIFVCEVRYDSKFISACKCLIAPAWCVVKMIHWILFAEYQLFLYVRLYVWTHWLICLYGNTTLHWSLSLCNKSSCSVTKLCLTLLWPHGL